VLPTILEAENLSKAYDRRPPLFSGVSLKLESGLVAVAGHNGSGKTTFLKILASLLRPGTGRVRVTRGGAELSGDEKRLAVGWAGPDLAMYDDFSARENLDFFGRAAGRPPDAADVSRRLEFVGLSEAADRRVGAFSTGMKQRLKLAFSILFDPPILLLDEPMLGLDTDGREAVERILEHQRRAGVVVLASNDPRDFVAPEQMVTLGAGKR
jgi:ABC-type multidrug transport system ATPase subunit